MESAPADSASLPSAAACLQPGVVRLDTRGLIAVQPWTLPRFECVVPVAEQLRWLARQVRPAYHELPVYDRSDLLQVLLSVELTPAPWHLVSGDHLLSAGVVLHRTPRRGEVSASVLGSAGVWSLTLKGQVGLPTPAEKQLAEAYGGFLAVRLPLDLHGPAVSAQVPAHPWALRRVWGGVNVRGCFEAAGVFDGPERRTAMPGVPDLYLQRFDTRVVEPHHGYPAPERCVSHWTTLSTYWRSFADYGVRPHLVPELLGKPSPRFQGIELLARRLLIERIHQWHTENGRPSLAGVSPSTPTPVRCMAGPTSCDDCCWNSNRPTPALSYQEAWAVALVAAAPLDERLQLSPPGAPGDIFDALLARAQSTGVLTDLAGLRFKHVPSCVIPPDHQEGTASLGWATGAQRFWGPVLGDHVAVHQAPDYLGGTRARCYTVLTTGGLVTLVVRLDHAQHWAEEARQLTWDREVRAIYGLTPLGFEEGPFVQAADGEGWGLYHSQQPPDKVYWWPALELGKNKLMASRMPDQSVWGWSPVAMGSNFIRAVSLLPESHAAEAPSPAALVYGWTPPAGGERAEALAALTLRQQNFLYLCARVRVEAGRPAGQRPPPAGCFYRGCRGVSCRVPLNCMPVHRRGLPGQILAGGGTLVSLPGAVSDGRRALLSDPPMPLDADCRLSIYWVVTAHLAANRGARLTPAQLALETGADYGLFLRAVLAELVQEGGRPGPRVPGVPLPSGWPRASPLKSKVAEYPFLYRGGVTYSATVEPGLPVVCPVPTRGHYTPAKARAQEAALWATEIPRLVPLEHWTAPEAEACPVVELEEQQEEAPPVVEPEEEEAPPLVELEEEMPLERADSPPPLLASLTAAVEGLTVSACPAAAADDDDQGGRSSSSGSSFVELPEEEEEEAPMALQAQPDANQLVQEASLLMEEHARDSPEFLTQLVGLLRAFGGRRRAD